MKKFERIAVIIILFSVIIATYAADFYRQRAVPIILYTHIGKEDQAQPLNNVSMESFEKQMAFLKKHQYQVISLDELVNAIERGDSLARKTVVLTFDDGYVENYHSVFPILKKYGFPATIFLITDYMNKQGFLTWTQMQEMQEQGIAAGSLTLSRAYLPGLSQSQQEKEIRASKKAIEKRLGQEVLHFAYPFGGFTPLTKKIVQEAGYLSASTINRGQDKSNRNVYELNRIRLEDKDQTNMKLRAKLSGYYHLFRRYVDPY